MRETRLSGSEGGAGSIPVPTPIEDAERERVADQDAPASWRPTKTRAPTRERPTTKRQRAGGRRKRARPPASGRRQRDL